MPPQLQQLMQDKRMLVIIGGVLALLLVVIIAVVAMNHGGKEGTFRKLNENEQVLAVVDSMGKALEIQALMAREKIDLVREDIEGGKASLKFQKDATLDDRDRALITLVQSGLMDKNVGLELFDKGDLTASREEKRIKLVRARNGELARLIRKIDPIQDASVFISMPEPTIFTKDMVPPSATVQVTLSPGERLTREKVRSIINLLVGSIENLDAKHVSLTDTNGTVYNSVLDATDELMDRLEERDHYMEQKVKTQLDKLIGVNKYVATVSTYLREAPKSEMALSYDPGRSAIQKSSNFAENLNAQQKGAGMAGGPVSSYVPDEVNILPNGMQRSEHGYARNGQEIEYNSGKQQVTEDFVAGMMEDITVAVTIDPNAYPANMTKEEFQTLIARAASPMVRPENVSIVTGQPEVVSPITPSVQPTHFEIPWWVWAGSAFIGFILFITMVKAFSKPGIPTELLQRQQNELQQLRELASANAQQLQAAQQQAQQMLSAQQQQLAQLASQQQIPIGAPTGAFELKETLSELQQIIQHNDEDDLSDGDLGTELRSWIEST